MKGKLFIFNEKMEIGLANESQYFAIPGETKEDFISRVETEFGKPLKLDELDLIKLKRYNIKQLQKRRNGKEGVELEMIQNILLSRGALDEHPAGEGLIINTTQTEEDIPKPLKKQMPEDEVQKQLESAKGNKGKKVEFICTKTKKKISGVIKGVRLDRRSNFIQYRILVEDKMYGKGIDSPDLEVK